MRRKFTERWVSTHNSGTHVGRQEKHHPKNNPDLKTVADASLGMGLIPDPSLWLASVDLADIGASVDLADIGAPNAQVYDPDNGPQSFRISTNWQVPISWVFFLVFRFSICLATLNTSMVLLAGSIKYPLAISFICYLSAWLQRFGLFFSSCPFLENAGLIHLRHLLHRAGPSNAPNAVFPNLMATNGAFLTFLVTFIQS